MQPKHCYDLYLRSRENLLAPRRSFTTWRLPLALPTLDETEIATVCLLAQVQQPFTQLFHMPRTSPIDPSFLKDAFSQPALQADEGAEGRECDCTFQAKLGRPLEASAAKELSRTKIVDCDRSIR
jgi:hypothetical protein